MDDGKIIDLYWQRNESAIEESDKKYGRYCRSIVMRILRSHEDSEECINDTYINAWNVIPPQRPTSLKAFLGCIARNLALNRRDYNSAQKRQASDDAVEELWEAVKPDIDIENEILMRELINKFLGSLDSKTRIIFMRRYWYFMSVKEISDMMSISENSISVTLHRTREKLKKQLEAAGISVG